MLAIMILSANPFKIAELPSRKSSPVAELLSKLRDSFDKGEGQRVQFENAWKAKRCVGELASYAQEIGFDVYTEKDKEFTFIWLERKESPIAE